MHHLSDRSRNHGTKPYFYEGGQEHGPACPSCSEQFLFQGTDGEIELIDEYHGKMSYSDGDYSDKDDMDDERILVGIVVPAPEEETR